MAARRAMKIKCAAWRSVDPFDDSDNEFDSLFSICFWTKSKKRTSTNNKLKVHSERT